MIDDEFGQLLLATFRDPDEHPVHVLFNEWWQHAPDSVKHAYVEAFIEDPRYRELAKGAHYAEPLDLATLAAFPAGSLGRCYHDWIVGNGLEAQIATNYRRFHESLKAAGMLAGMPEPMKCAVLRGFQTHDFQHVVTGYDASGQGEIALQAFCLAQLQFPYFGIWMSVITTRATFVDPRMIVPMMDAVADGWQLGRRVANIQAERWENHLDEPLERIRARYGMNPSALAERLAARRSGFKRQTVGRSLS